METVIYHIIICGGITGPQTYKESTLDNKFPWNVHIVNSSEQKVHYRLSNKLAAIHYSHKVRSETAIFLPQYLVYSEVIILVSNLHIHCEELKVVVMKQAGKGLGRNNHIYITLSSLRRQKSLQGDCQKGDLILSQRHGMLIMNTSV